MLEGANIHAFGSLTHQKRVHLPNTPENNRDLQHKYGLKLALNQDMCISEKETKAPPRNL